MFLDCRAADRQPPSLRSPVARGKTFELLLAYKGCTVQEVAGQQGQYAKAVNHARVKARARGFLEISGWYGNFFDPKPEVDCLNQHLLIENKIVGVEQKRNLLQDASIESPIAGMIFGKILSQSPVLNRRQHPIAQEFPPGHPLLHDIPAH